MKRFAIAFTMMAGLLVLAACTADESALIEQTEAEVAAVEQASDEEVEAPMTDRVADADVVNVRVVEADDGTWVFHVTVSHADTGWEDYADGWDVVLPDGTPIKPDASSPFTRLLMHPHEDEQPFTRLQSRIVIPPGVTQVTVRAHDLVDGFGGREVLVDLTLDSGDGFVVERAG